MKKKVLCTVCGSAIPDLRLKYLPETTTCVACSQTKPYSSEDVLGVVNIDDYTPDFEDYENEYSGDGPIETCID